MKAQPVPFEKFVNLADARLGTKIISVTDDWFADANRLFQPTPAVWKESVFDVPYTRRRATPPSG